MSLKDTIQKIDALKSELDALRPIKPEYEQRIRQKFRLDWTYHSNSIEGNTLTLQETQMVLQEGITVKGKSLREHFEAKNHEKAIHFLYDIISDNYELRSIDVLSIHSLVLNMIE